MAEITRTPAEIVKTALLLIGAVDRDKALTGSELNNGVDSLNAMLASWPANILKVLAVTKTSFTTVVGQSSYTIGPSGADWTADRPMDVLDAYIRAGTIDYPLEKIGRTEYNQLVAKQDSDRPCRFYYHPTATTGTIYFDYKPIAAETIYLDLHQGLGNFTNPDTAITLPANYIEPIQYNLALRLANEYGMVPSEDVRGIAFDTLGELKTLNSEPLISNLEAAISSYDSENRKRGGFGF